MLTGHLRASHDGCEGETASFFDTGYVALFRIPLVSRFNYHLALSYVREASESYHIMCTANLSSPAFCLPSPTSHRTQESDCPATHLTTTLWEGDGLSRRYSWSSMLGVRYVTTARCEYDITAKLCELSDEQRAHFLLPIRKRQNFLRLVSFYHHVYNVIFNEGQK